MRNGAPLFCGQTGEIVSYGNPLKVEDSGAVASATNLYAGVRSVALSSNRVLAHVQHTTSSGCYDKLYLLGVTGTNLSLLHTLQLSGTCVVTGITARTNILLRVSSTKAMLKSGNRAMVVNTTGDTITTGTAITVDVTNDGYFGFGATMPDGSLVVFSNDNACQAVRYDVSGDDLFLEKLDNFSIMVGNALSGGQYGPNSFIVYKYSRPDNPRLFLLTYDEQDKMVGLDFVTENNDFGNADAGSYSFTDGSPVLSPTRALWMSDTNLSGQRLTGVGRGTMGQIQLADVTYNGSQDYNLKTIQRLSENLAICYLPELFGSPNYYISGSVIDTTGDNITLAQHDFLFAHRSNTTSSAVSSCAAYPESLGHFVVSGGIDPDNGDNACLWAVMATSKKATDRPIFPTLYHPIKTKTYAELRGSFVNPYSVSLVKLSANKYIASCATNESGFVISFWGVDITNNVITFTSTPYTVTGLYANLDSFNGVKVTDTRALFVIRQGATYVMIDWDGNTANSPTEAARVTDSTMATRTNLRFYTLVEGSKYLLSENTGRHKIIDVSGTTITPGTYVTTPTAWSTNFVSVVVNATKFVSVSASSKMVIGTVSGSSISFGNEVACGTMYNDDMSGVLLETDKVLVTDSRCTFILLIDTSGSDPVLLSNDTSQYSGFMLTTANRSVVALTANRIAKFRKNSTYAFHWNCIDVSGTTITNNVQKSIFSKNNPNASYSYVDAQGHDSSHMLVLAASGTSDSAMLWLRLYLTQVPTS